MAVTFVLLAVLRSLLALVFSVSALTKLADRGGFKSALGNFGVPERLQPPVALLVPQLPMFARLMVPRRIRSGALPRTGQPPESGVSWPPDPLDVWFHGVRSGTGTPWMAGFMGVAGLRPVPSRGANLICCGT
jgi:hypothetical protein